MIDVVRMLIGKYCGSLSLFIVVELGIFVIKELLDKIKLKKDKID